MTNAIKPPSEVVAAIFSAIDRAAEYWAGTMGGLPTGEDVSEWLSNTLKPELEEWAEKAALTANAPVGEPVAYIDPSDLEYFKREIYADAEVLRQPRLSEDGRDYVPLYTHLPVAVGADEIARAEILTTLREHHDWHLRAGSIGLQDGDGGWIEIDNAAEYSDSALYARTAKLLEGAPPEELQPIPRGGMNTWWWEQAILLRRKLRDAKKALQFYADPNNWIDTPSWDGDPSCMTPKAIPVKQEDGLPCDCGDTARDALALISGKKANG